MSFMLRQRQLAVTVWLVLQATSMICALTPRECCAAHRPKASRPADRCPMKASDGAACPMHHAVHTNVDSDQHAHHQSTERPAGDCALRGTCSGPTAPSVALLSQHGVLTPGFVLTPDLQVSTVPAAPTERLVRALIPPDAPPPRS